MPYLTNLATVVRRSGLKVVEVPGWKTRGHGPMSTIQTITCHHTATPRSFKRDSDYPTMGVVRDGRPGLRGPLAQLGLGRNGTVYVIAAGLSYHAGRSQKTSQTNSRAIGIEAEGAMESWPRVQYDAYVRLVAALLTEWPNAEVVGHKESAAPKGRKNDPSFNMSDFRAAVRKVNLGSKPAPTAPTETTDSKGVLGMTKRINAQRRTTQKATGTRHLMVDDKGNYTIVDGPAAFTVAAKADINGLKPGEHGYLILAEVMYKKGQPTVISREIAAVKVTSNTTETVSGAFTLPKEYKGKSPRLRLVFKTASKTATASNIVVSGIRD